jgi:plastocyanin
MSIGRSSTASEMESENSRSTEFEKRRLYGALSLFLWATSAAAGPVSGVVQTTVRAGTTATQAVVFAEPLDRPATPKGVKASLMQKDKSFSPDVLGVPVGSTIDFPNADSIFHNVFSLSPPGPFDLGLYRAGASRTRVFSAPATYRVFCNIHPQMTAVVVVVPTSFVTVTGKDGSFSLELPPGTYRLTAISGRAAPTVREISVPASGLRVDGLALDERPFRDEPHKNKFGKEYPREAYRQ